MTIEKRFKSKFPRTLLNEVKWKGCDLSQCTIYYDNRGSPNDTASIKGGQIKKIDSMFLIFDGDPLEKYIPYHRISRIELEDEIIFEHY